MKKLLTLTALALVLSMMLPALAHAGPRRVDLGAHGGAVISGEREFHGRGLGEVGIQLTWPVASWAEIGLRQSVTFTGWNDGLGGSCEDDTPASDTFVMITNTMFVARFHVGDRVRVTAGAGLSHFFSRMVFIAAIPNPVATVDLDVVLVRKGRHELTFRAGGQLAAMMWSEPYFTPRAGLSWSF